MLGPIERLRLARELSSIRKDLAANPGTMARLKLAQRIAAVRKALGVGAAPTPVPPPVDDNSPPPIDLLTGDDMEEVAEGKKPRLSTSQFYDFDPNRKPAQRKLENAAAMAIIAQINEGTLKPGSLTDAQKEALAKYSGTGGNLTGADGKKGSAYEYYTPKPIAEGMWALLREHGFSGGRVLDPCSAVGVFGATAPVNAAIDAIELNETSGRVNQLVNDGPGYKAVIAPFEQVAAATPDETHDAIITNVPFGDVNDRGGNQFKDKKHQKEPIQNYFLLRSLEKLRPGGLACFITPPRCVSGKGGKDEELRVKCSYMAEFIGAYRLPNSVFGTAAADTMTDVMLFRKFDAKTLEKVEELREQDPQVLIDAGVLWQEFIGGTYFQGQGLRHILGTMAKAKGQWGEKDVLNSDLSMSDIAKLIRKFPDSHINWELLNTTETAPIVYRDGDTIRHAGQTLEMIDGLWHAIESATSEAADSERAELLARLQTPLGAVNNGVEFDAASAFCATMVDMGQALDIPDWMRPLVEALDKRVVAGARAANWQAAICGLAIDQVMGEHQAEEVGFNYLEGYAVLSDLMKRVLATAKGPATALPMSIKNAMRKVSVNYSKADGYSAVWRGDVVTESADSRTDAQKYEAERYQAGGGQFVPMDKAREVYGPTFDPMGSEEWCLSPDGQSVAKADDYYVGSYGDFLAKIDADIAAAASDAIRDKLLTQKRAAAARVNMVDVTRMHFTLFSPFVKLEEKAEFLRRFVDSRFAVGFDEETGEPGIVFDMVGQPKNERDKLLKRFALYLNGSRLTLGGIETSDAKKAIAELRRIATTADSQFNSWVKANTVVMGRMHDVANDPQRLYFQQVEDDSPLTIPGLNPDWKVSPYQNSWVRRMGREFAGINGFGVGLGKTSSSLIAVQHAHSIGTKKKSIFVVPNSVLSNWRKEAMRVYASVDDCLFVGLREQKDGSFKTDPGAYDQDLNRILENRHRKIYMTYEAFGRLRLRAETAAAYDVYLAESDSSYAASDSKKADEKGKSRRAALIDQLTNDSSKSVGAPFFEDLGIDSLVIDEGHFLKNSRETVEFKGGKFLSLAQASARGLDAQAKAWFVRKDTPRKDGVILLSATPITNSPLEIYSMLSLAVGDSKLNDLMLGIKGADEFMEVMCEMENKDEETLDGLVKPYDVFVGLNNVDVLRKALDACCTIRTAEQVGEQIVMPDADMKTVNVNLPQSVVDTLIEYKGAFRYAIDNLSGKKDNRGDPQAYERVAAKFGEPEELIGHPFNLINKMAMLIADPELDQRATFYRYSPAQQDKVESLVAAWNAKAPIEDRPREAPHTRPEAVVGTKTKKDGEDKVTLLKIKVLAEIDATGHRVILDTMDAQNQAAFDAMADKQGVDFDVNIPPKLAALLENFQYEEAHPRGKHRIDGQVIASGRVRQLIFCDVLALHGKIKRMLTKKCGIPASSIVIVTGKVNGKPEEILDVQDGFNAEGKENKYRVVIANEKAEVGINLQKGTQAIHHMTLGWTPDSITQRDGRGVRQGNETGYVNVYHYDAGGTFDSYKRMLVGKKSNWIDNVMDPDGGDHVTIEGGMSREKMEAMIETVGDSDGMSRAQAREEATERAAREVSTRGKQRVNLSTMKAQQEFVTANASPVGLAADKIGLYVALRVQKATIEDRIANPKATASAVLKNQNLLAEIDARLKGLRRVLDASVQVFDRGYKSKELTPSSLDAWLSYFNRNHKSREDKALKVGDLAAKRVRETVGSTYGYVFQVSEESEIGNEWRSELDMANAMIDASMEDFKRLGKQDGGMSDLVLARFATGDAAIFDGNVVCVGAFMEHGQYLGSVRKVRGTLQTIYWDDQGRNKALTVSDDIRKSTVTLPGSPGFDALVTRAAKMEDALAESGEFTPEKAELLYSAVIPEVGQRRSKPMLVNYSSVSYGLPPPYVSLVLPQDLTGPEYRVVPMIAEKQKAIVKSTKSDGYSVEFQADASAGIVDAKSDAVIWTELRDWAKANGVRITSSDFAVMKRAMSAHGSTFTSVSEDNEPDFKATVIDGATSESELKSRLLKWLRDDLLPAYDVEADETYKQNPLSFLYQICSSYRYEYDDAMRRIKRAEEAAAAAANQPAAVVPPVVAPGQEDQPAPPTVEEGDPMRMVGFTGNTKKWKDQIKQYANIAGGRAIWDGDALCWNAPFKAWGLLTAAYPAAGQELQIVEASGKTNYKRR